MRIVKSVSEFRTLRHSLRNSTLGFVPTMGALHEGHLSLMRQAKSQCDIVVSSLFVNPTQFGPNEDFDRYPRTFESDVNKMIQSQCVDILLAPETSDMYSKDFCTRVVLDENCFLKHQPEAQQRPGFFNGVATVVTKLFNIVSPTDAFFGQKDAVQCIVVRKIVRDLNMEPTVHIVPTVREEDGLAMSSRNRYLSPQDRTIAPVLYQVLSKAEQHYLSCKSRGETTKCEDLVAMVKDQLASNRHCQQGDYTLEYVSLCCAHTGQILDHSRDSPPSDGAILSAVIKIGGVRLLDNVVLQA